MDYEYFRITNGQEGQFAAHLLVTRSPNINNLPYISIKYGHDFSHTGTPGTRPKKYVFPCFRL
jgi:hypothetical protein